MSEPIPIRIKNKIFTACEGESEDDVRQVLVICAAYLAVRHGVTRLELIEKMSSVYDDCARRKNRGQL